MYTLQKIKVYISKQYTFIKNVYTFDKSAHQQIHVY